MIRKYQSNTLRCQINVHLFFYFFGGGGGRWGGGGVVGGFLDPILRSLLGPSLLLSINEDFRTFIHSDFGHNLPPPFIKFWIRQ